MDTQKGLSFSFLHSSNKLNKAVQKLESKFFISLVVCVAIVAWAVVWFGSTWVVNNADQDSIGAHYPWLAYVFGFVLSIPGIFLLSSLLFTIFYGSFERAFFRQTKFGKLTNENFRQLVDWMSNQFNVSVKYPAPSACDIASVQIMTGEYENFVFEDKNGVMYCLRYVDAEKTVLNVSRIKTSNSESFVLLTEEYDDSFYTQKKELHVFNLLINNTNLVEDLRGVVSEVEKSFASLRNLELSRAQATTLASIKEETERLSSKFLKVETLADDELNSLIINAFSLLKDQLDAIRDEMLADAKSNIVDRLSLIESGMITA